MKRQLRTFLSGFLCAALIFALALSALAIAGRMTIEVDPINIQVNGQTFVPKDVTGKEVPVFAYEGTTYAPLRALAEAYGLSVGYDPQTNLATVQDPGKAPAERYTVGICQAAHHSALDRATQGFIDVLNQVLPGQVTFDYQTAAGSSRTECSVVVNKFVADDVDLMLCNGIPALQAAAGATMDIPILGTCVAQYGVTLDLGSDFSGIVGGNISGTSDLAPLGAQAAMIREWSPQVKTVGIVYCANDANSQCQVDMMKTELEKLGCTAELYAFADSNGLADVVQNAVDNSDVLYVPVDIAVANNTDVIDRICRPAKKPVFCGEEGICMGCGVATLSMSYYDLGAQTGKMAARVLTGEADISTMPIEYVHAFVPKYNAEICADLGLTPPEGYIAIDTY